MLYFVLRFDSIIKIIYLLKSDYMHTTNDYIINLTIKNYRMLHLLYKCIYLLSNIFYDCQPVFDDEQIIWIEIDWRPLNSQHKKLVSRLFWAWCRGSTWKCFQFYYLRCLFMIELQIIIWYRNLIEVSCLALMRTFEVVVCSSFELTFYSIFWAFLSSWDADFVLRNNKSFE